MGKRGFPPKKAALKVLSGKLPVTKENLGPVLAVPTLFIAPDAFSSDLLSVWGRTIQLLGGAGLIGNVDVSMLEAYCRAYVHWQKVEADFDKMLKESGSFNGAFVIKGSQSPAMLHPIVKAARDARQDVVQYAIQLGMTPSARLRMESGAVGVVEKKANVFKRLREAGKIGSGD